MLKDLKGRLYRTLRKSEKYTRTDMVYFARGGFWVTFGQGVMALSGLALAVGFANFLEKNDYGTYKYLLSILSLLSITSLPGMGTAITRAVAKGFDQSFFTGLRFSIACGLLGSIAALFLTIYYWIQDNFIFSLAFLIAAPFVPLLGSLVTYKSYLNGKKLFKKIALYSNISQACIVISLLVTVFFTGNILLLLLVYLLSTTFFHALFLFISIRVHRPNNRDEVGLRTYGLHLSVIKGFGIAVATLQNIVLVQFSGVVSLAVYTLAVAPIEQVRGSTNFITALVLPKAASTHWTLPRLPLLLTKLAYPVAVMGMLIILYIASAPLIYSILFPFYPEAVFYSQILAVGLIPTLGINILSSILKARKETKKIYIANIVSGVLQLSLSLVLMYFFGLLGLSIGIVTYKSIMLIFYFFLLYVASKKTEPPMSDKSAPVL